MVVIRSQDVVIFIFNAKLICFLLQHSSKYAKNNIKKKPISYFLK